MFFAVLPRAFVPASIFVLHDALTVRLVVRPTSVIEAGLRVDHAAVATAPAVLPAALVVHDTVGPSQAAFSVKLLFRVKAALVP